MVDAAVLSAVSALSAVSPAAARGPGAVNPDGCSVELYALLPAGGEAELVHRSIPAGASVLDLGCGTGRIAAPLAALGHEVVAVDESAEMLALVHDVRPVRAHIQDLRLPTTFDAVLLASHLLNTPGADDRQALLATCRAHVSAGGQWHPPQWFDALRAGTTHEGELGPVRAGSPSTRLTRACSTPRCATGPATNTGCSPSSRAGWASSSWAMSSPPPGSGSAAGSTPGTAGSVRPRSEPGEGARRANPAIRRAAPLRQRQAPLAAPPARAGRGPPTRRGQRRRRTASRR